jgi:hypothetical protein
MEQKTYQAALPEEMVIKMDMIIVMIQQVWLIMVVANVLLVLHVRLVPVTAIQILIALVI